MFRAFRQSVRFKLLVLMLATTLVALVVAVAVLVAYDSTDYYDRVASDLTTQADILGRSSVAALAFDDRAAARDTLALLKVRPAILEAAIYDESGVLFAEYVGDGHTAAIPPKALFPGVRVQGKEIALFQPIVESGRTRGTVYLRERYELVERVRNYLGILAAVSALSLGAALLISAFLQRAITKPILDITGVAQDVMVTRDYSRRVTRTTEDETGYLVDAFNNMLGEVGRRSEALLRADRMKDQFLAMLAHELRNPLAPISNGLHLLERAGDKPQLAAQARAMMARQVKQLVRLVDDLLDVSRITTGKLVLRDETVELGAVVDNAVEIARPVIDAREHTLEVEAVDGPVFLRGDATRLAQVFSNLLNNAAKYTPPGGRIELRVAIEGDRAAVTVTDNGIGMTRETLHEVFEMFTQANTAIDREQSGLGVGLALARYLVEAHGGTIEGESAGLSKGSRFTVRLPLVRSPTGPSHPFLEPDAAPAPGQRVLVVDDNRDFAASLAMILRDMGNEVRVEHDGPGGLAAAESFQPDVAFLDIGLPGMDGYDLARRIRASGNASVLIAVTGWGQAADKARSHAAGFDHHVVKPLEPAELPWILGAAQRARADVKP
ncbi:MAG TPA: ATP-binding protein [Burkholderiales bacterium]|nr:ATP-binding protein [Burkholderiales bacterium]